MTRGASGRGRVSTELEWERPRNRGVAIEDNYPSDSDTTTVCTATDLESVGTEPIPPPRHRCAKGPKLATTNRKDGKLDSQRPQLHSNSERYSMSKNTGILTSRPVNVPRDARSEADSKVRMLTREVGKLREELDHERKRREHAVARSRQQELSCEEAERQVAELRYSNKQLAAELLRAKESAAAATARNRDAIAGLRRGLASVEDEVAHRSHLSYAYLQQAFAHVQTLQGALYAHSADGGNAPAHAHPEVQRCFADILRTLSAVSGMLASPSNMHSNSADACLSSRIPSPPPPPPPPSLLEHVSPHSSSPSSSSHRSHPANAHHYQHQTSHQHSHSSSSNRPPPHSLGASATHWGSGYEQSHPTKPGQHGYPGAAASATTTHVNSAPHPPNSHQAYAQNHSYGAYASGPGHCHPLSSSWYPGLQNQPPYPHLNSTNHHNNHHSSDAKGGELVVSQRAEDSAAATAVLVQRIATLEADRDHLTKDVSGLSARLAEEQQAAVRRDQENEALQEENAKASALIPQYRALLIKAKAACASMKERLTESQSETNSLREEVGLLQQAVRERDTSATSEIEKLQEAVREMDQLSQQEMAQLLERERAVVQQVVQEKDQQVNAELARLHDCQAQIRTLEQKLQERDEALREMRESEATIKQSSTEMKKVSHTLENELTLLRTQVAEKESKLAQSARDHQQLEAHAAELEELTAQQRSAISELQSTISAQRTDIRAALEMVVSKRPKDSAQGSPSSEGAGRGRVEPTASNPTMQPAHAGGVPTSFPLNTMHLPPHLQAVVNEALRSQQRPVAVGRQHPESSVGTHHDFEGWSRHTAEDHIFNARRAKEAKPHLVRHLEDNARASLQHVAQSSAPLHRGRLLDVTTAKKPVGDSQSYTTAALDYGMHRNDVSEMPGVLSVAHGKQYSANQAEHNFYSTSNCRAHSLEPHLDAHILLEAQQLVAQSPQRDCFSISEGRFPENQGLDHDMAALDAEITSLEASLKAAAVRIQ